MNPTAGQVAYNLRRIADALDKSPESKVEQVMVSFYCNDHSAADKGKSVFLTLARLLPHPLQKDFTDSTLTLVYKNEAINLRAQIDRVFICTLREPARPAVYDCPSILSDEEEAALGPF